MKTLNFIRFKYSFFFKMILALFLPLGSSISASQNLWVVNADNNTVSVIDTSTNTLIDTITQSTGMFNEPVYLSFTPDGSYCYVDNLSDSSISVIRVSDRSFVAKIVSSQAGLNENYSSAVTPDGKFLYVTNYASGTSDCSVSVISTSHNTFYQTISSGSGQFSGPYPIAISPDGATVYVGNYDNTTISVIDVSSNMLTNRIIDSTFTYLCWITFTPDGKYAYTANYYDGPLGSVSVINTSTFAVTNISAVAGAFANPINVQFNPKGTRAYVANSGNSSVSVIDTSNQGLIATISDETFSGTTATVLTSNGKLLYVLNLGTNSIAIVRTSDNTIIGHINDIGLSGSLAMQLVPRTSVQPPRGFKGIVEKHELKTTWHASPSPDVVSYKIYNGKQLVGSVSADSPLKFTASITCKNEAENFKIAAYNSSGVSSKRVKIKLVDD